MLRRYNNPRFKAWILPQASNHGRKFDCLRTRADDKKYFQFAYTLLVTISDAALGQIVRRKLQCDAIAREHADTIAAELARQVRKHGAFLVKLHAEQAARKFFNYGTGYFNAVFFAH